jgi:hypothetical protein
MLSPLLLLVIPFWIVGCTPFPHPPYQPLTTWSFPKQGYIDYQIDVDTFLVTYERYRNFEPLGFLQERPLQDKWLKGAQEYVLYRAAEVARGQGAARFLVLHRNDWNLIGVETGRYNRGMPIVWPGASLIIRTLGTVSSGTNEDIYEVGAVLTSLPMENRGLRPAAGLPIEAEGTKPSSDVRFTRWGTRQSLGSMPLTAEGLNLRNSPETKVTQLSDDRFEVFMWGRQQLSPIEFLGECTKLAERKGYEFFTLLNWRDVEHGGRIPSKWVDEAWKIWFETRATVILQHKRTPEILEAVFRVQEVKPNVDMDTIKRNRQAERDAMIDRDLKAGLIY